MYFNHSTLPNLRQFSSILHIFCHVGGGGPMKQSYNANMHFKKPYEKVQRTVRQPNHIPTEALGAKDFAKYPEPLIGICLHLAATAGNLL